MKLLALGFAFLSIALTMHAQTTFFKWIPSPFHENILGTAQTSNGDFLLVGEKGNNPDTVHGYCVIINNNGDVIQTLDLNSGNRISRLGTINSYPGSQHRFIITGGNDSLNSMQYKSALMLMVINDSLQIIQSKEIEMEPGRRIVPWKAVIVEDSIIYLLARYDTISTFVDFIVLKLNMELSILNRFHHQSNFPANVPQDIFFNQRNETLYVYYFGPVIKDRASSNNVLCLDRNLGYIYGTPAESMIGTNISAIPISDSIFYLTGSSFSNNTSQHKAIGIYLVNDSNRTLKASEFWDNYDTLVFPSRGGHTMSVDQTHATVCLSGIFNLEPIDYPYQTTPTWVQFVRTDFNLNIKEHVLYGGDAVYVPFCNITTNEGGVFITGFRYNYLHPDEKRFNIFMLKTDSAGRVLSIPENQKELMSEAILAPNPGNEYCIALLGAQYKSATLRLYNMHGETVLCRDIRQQKTKIALPGLAKGIYPYSFEYEGRIIGSGKWIRE